MLDPNTKISSRASTRITMFVLASIICAAVFVGVMVSRQAADAQRQLHQDIVLRGGDAVGLSFNMAIKREWASLHAVARNVGTSSQQQTNDFMDAVAQTGGQVAWAGVADLSGKVVSGSNRRREGEDVSERRWYQEGLRGPNVGNVHNTTSLKRDNQETGERLLNLSTPIYDADSGEISGVVVYSVRMAWVSSFLSQAREQLNVDIVVQNREGETLVDTRDEPTVLPEAAVVQAGLGRSAAGSFRIVGDSGGLFAIAPNFVTDELPDFGWRVYALLDSDGVANVLPGLLTNAIIAVAIAASFVLAVTLVTLRLVLRPFEELTETAVQIANGKDVYPIETRASREAIMLSRALVLIQSKVEKLPKLKEAGAPVLEMLRPSAARNDADAGEPESKQTDKRQTRLGEKA
ncbi:cache domain-containing protein [Sulfitobacter sp. HNIBRBA3233]|uniref:cache domain-containing protein n=1 Tax=Sulfitobacter marinivivus TaxID=3158558 RepID=UPI0032E03CBE